MSDPEMDYAQWQRDNDPFPPRRWENEIPFEGEPVPDDMGNEAAESVPGGVGNEAADTYADLRDSGLDRDFAAAMVDASYMTFPEWYQHHGVAA